MSIEFSYSITQVDAPEKMMTVQYSSVGKETITIGIRLPFADEDFDEYMKLNAPIFDWELEGKLVSAPTVGVSGDLSFTSPPLVDPVTVAIAEYLDAAEPVPLYGVKAVEGVHTENLTLLRRFNSKANLVALEIVGLQGDLDSTEDETKMFNSSAKVTEQALLRGVQVFAVSKAQSIIDFLVNDHSYTSKALGEGQFLLTLPQSTALTAALVASRSKESRVRQIDKIVVTIASGKVFDGDEVSQGRMARAVAFGSAGDTTSWVLADNTVATVTHAELKEAGLLAGQKQTLITVA